MTQRWLHGTIEGDYVGTPQKRRRGSLHPSAKAFTLRVLRATVANPSLVDESASQVPAGVHVLHQRSLADTFVVGGDALGVDGTVVLHDLRISGVRLSFPAKRNGRTYGRLHGEVTARFEVPPPPPPPPQPAPVPAALSPAAAPMQPAPADSSKPAAKRKAPGGYVEPPLLICVLAAAAPLLFFCGLPRAALWLLFALPTLLLRRIVRESWAPSPFTRGASIVLVAWQLGWAGVLALDWWAHHCQRLLFFPVMALILGMYLAGSLPRARAFLVNAAVLALVLMTWGAPLGRACP